MKYDIQGLPCRLDRLKRNALDFRRYCLCLCFGTNMLHGETIVKQVGVSSLDCRRRTKEAKSSMMHACPKK
jgi:hypothetical protein